jgi:hypothetical protein
VKPLALFLALLLSSGAAAAQGLGQLSAQVTVGVPQGAFSERLDGAIGFGVSLQALHHIPATPVAVGVELGGLVYGVETIRERFGGGALGRVEVDVTTQNNIGLGHLLLRLQPPAGAFRPYVDGLVGMSYLFTDSRIQDVDRNRPEIASSTNFDDLTFSYGGSVGMQARLVRGVDQKSGRPYEFGLDARLRYLRGGEADYLKRGSISQDSAGNLTYEVERSRTDLLLPQLGLVVRF